MKAGRKGVTLVELLVALGIFAVVGAALARALGAAIDSWRREERRAEAQQEARAVLERMARELRNAVPAPGDGFLGKADALAFYTARDVPAAGAASRPSMRVVRVRYSVEDGPLGKRLARREESVDRSAAPVEESPSLPADVRFAYVYAPRKSGDLLWGEAWDFPSLLPAGVRVSLTVGDPSSPEGTEVFVKTVEIPAALLRARKA